MHNTEQRGRRFVPRLAGTDSRPQQHCERLSIASRRCLMPSRPLRVGSGSIARPRRPGATVSKCCCRSPQPHSQRRPTSPENSHILTQWSQRPERRGCRRAGGWRRPSRLPLRFHSRGCLCGGALWSRTPDFLCDDDHHRILRPGLEGLMRVEPAEQARV